MTHSIHPTAIVAPEASIAAEVTVGPYCIIGPHVVLEKGVTLQSHVVIDGHTNLGAGVQMFPFSSISVPQDLKYAGEPSRVEVGERTIIREYATINPGTAGGTMLTKVGSDCLLMISTHVAHDCIVGNHVIMANHATLAGHVEVGDHAIIGGLSAVHQKVRIGVHAIIGGMSAVEKDVIPFGMVKGERAFLAGLNLVGMKRRGFTRQAMQELRETYEAIFHGVGALAEVLAALQSQSQHSPEVKTLLDFLTADNARPICQPKENDRGEDA
jgi:UDP-N-acetylglucosamine acyltransferase